MTADRTGRRGIAVTVSVSALTALVGYRTLSTRPPGGAALWARINYAGRPVTLLAGPAAAMGALVGLAVAPGLPVRTRAAALLAGSAAGVLGGYDDLVGDGSAKGLRGHLAAMRQGQLTTGGVKLLGIGAACAVAGATARPRHDRLLDRALAGVVVAGTANLVNLLDLRPGRAAKVLLLLGGPGVLSGGGFGAAVAAPTGAAAAMMGPDLAEEAMLGDAGANALGAMVGVALAAAAPSRRSLVGAAVVVTAANLASERFSFSRVIAVTPGLSHLDRWGRRPADPARHAQGAGGLEDEADR
jgi:UDP-GlcNAc:undecaprenyl-phosphate GlcNAc-1-phosphate transferase